MPSGARPVSHQRRHATAVTATAAATSRGSARIGSSILRHPTAARRSEWRSSGRPPSRTFGPTAVGGMHTTAHATARRSPTYIIRATLVPRSDSPPARVTAGIRAVASRSRDWPRTAGTPGKPPRSTPAPASTGIPPRANVTARVPPDRSPSRIDPGGVPGYPCAGCSASRRCGERSVRSSRHSGRRARAPARHPSRSARCRSGRSPRGGPSPAPGSTHRPQERWSGTSRGRTRTESHSGQRPGGAPRRSSTRARRVATA